jgi:hypothetical protein
MTKAKYQKGISSKQTNPLQHPHDPYPNSKQGMLKN